MERVAILTRLESDEAAALRHCAVVHTRSVSSEIRAAVLAHLAVSAESLNQTERPSRRSAESPSNVKETTSRGEPT